MLVFLLACTPSFTPSAVPRGYENHGIDVSAWQRRIDWDAVAGSGEVQFAFVKATEGSTHVDRRFAANWSGALDVGMPVGAYHYFSACRTGREQAEHFLATVPFDEAGLPPVLDVEVDGRCNGPERLGEAMPEVQVWLDLVEEAVGRRPLVYGSDRFQQDALGALEHPRWVAAWSGAPRRTPGWEVWQHTDRGSVPGIRGPVDRNVAKDGVDWLPDGPTSRR